MVSSRAPWSSSAHTSSVGIPAMPKPPMRIVAPSGTSASASAAEATILSSTGDLPWRAGRRGTAMRAGRASRTVAEACRAGLAQRRGEAGELDEQLAGVRRIDDVLDDESLGAAERRSERAHASLDLGPLRLRIGRRLDLRLVGHLESTFDRQRTPLGARPGVAEAEAARMLVGA